MYFFDCLVATICLAGLMGYVTIPLEVLMACTIVYLYSKLFVTSTA